MSSIVTAWLGVSENKFLEKQLQVYPNPNNGMLYINSSSFETFNNLTAVIYDALGRVILNQPLASEISFEGLDPSFYYLKIYHNSTKKILHSEKVLYKK